MNTPSYILELIADALRVDDLELVAICEAAQRGDAAALRSCEVIQTFKAAGDIYLSPHTPRPAIERYISPCPVCATFRELHL